MAYSNLYNNLYDDMSMRQQEYEMRRMKEQMYRDQQYAMQNLPEKPKKPQHLNQKLLLTKG